MNEVYKMKKSGSGSDKMIKKDDSFNPKESDRYEKVSKSLECLYEGAYILGTNKIIKWEIRYVLNIDNSITRLGSYS